MRKDYKCIIIKQIGDDREIESLEDTKKRHLVRTATKILHKESMKYDEIFTVVYNSTDLKQEHKVFEGSSTNNYIDRPKIKRAMFY